MTASGEPAGAGRPTPTRRRRWPLSPFRTLILAVVVILVVVVTVVVITVTMPRPAPNRCGTGLTDVQGSCIGISGSSDFGDPKLSAVMAEIDAQNKAIPGGDHYSIGYLLPLEPVDHQTSLSTELRHELEGAVNAQAELNARSAVKIKLLVANAGPDNAQWQTVVPALRQAAAGPDRLRAVAGFGHSLAETKEAIRALTADGATDGSSGVAAIGSRLTADSLSTDPRTRQVQGFFRVDPSNTDEAIATAALLRTRHVVRPLLVSDQDKSDDYVTSLATAFTSAFGPTTRGTFNHSKDAVAISFDTITRNLCATPPDAVYFAGRGDALAEFVHSLAGRNCSTTPVDIYTASDIAGLRDALQKNDPVLVGALTAGRGPGGVTVTYTGLAHPGMWTDPNPDPTLALAGAFNKAEVSALTSRAPVPSDLSDGAAIMAHDAVLLASTAMNNLVGLQQEVTPSAVVQALGAVHGAGAAMPGASGLISLDTCGDTESKIFPILTLGPDGTPKYITSARGTTGDLPCT